MLEGGFDQLNNVSEQERKLKVLSANIQELMKAAADSNDSSCSDEMIEMIEEFKEQNPDISAEYVAEAIKEAA